MKIFALETDVAKFNRTFVSEGEQLLCTIRFHGFVFAVKLITTLFWTALLTTVGIVAWEFAMSGAIIFGIGIVIWLFVLFPPLLRSFIDWRFDVLILTTEKLIVVDQSSVFRREIRQMSLENVASSNAETQFWNLFSFGRLCFDLKEGVGERLCLAYIPHADDVATCIGDALVKFERGQRSGGAPAVTMPSTH